jgi:ABC-type transport system substrate-binding protein
MCWPELRHAAEPAQPPDRYRRSIGFLTADYTCAGTYNLSHFSNPEYDRIIGEAATTVDP